jgi:hypothetical protein
MYSFSCPDKSIAGNNPHQEDRIATDKFMKGSGEIDDLYQFLEQSGSHNVSLLA